MAGRGGGGVGRRFLVTGATGFIGANLCRRLVEQGEEVHVIVRRQSNRWRIADLAGNLHMHEADICEADEVERVFAAARPDVIYHLATHGAYSYQTDGQQILITNVFGLWNLLQSAKKRGYELFVNTGSSSEYGQKDFAMREADVLEPNSFYAVAKSAQSLLCQHSSRMNELPIVTLRLFSVYGPWEEPKRFIPTLMMAAIEGRPIDMVSRETARDFVHIDDVVDAYLMIDKLKVLRGEILNVGTGVQDSVAQVVQAMEEVISGRVDATWGKMAPRTWDSDVWVADASKLRRLTGFTPRTTIREGLARSLPWFRSHMQFYADKAGAK
jgi:nucleoside-diphosphate-sugar epimerase